MFNETENEIRLRRANEALEYARENSQRAAQAAFAAAQAFSRAKERVEELHFKVEAELIQRRKATYDRYTG